MPRTFILASISSSSLCLGFRGRPASVRTDRSSPVIRETVSALSGAHRRAVRKSAPTCPIMAADNSRYPESGRAARGPPKVEEGGPHMRRTCAWCSKEMGVTQGVQPGVTHGICGRCTEGILREYEANTNRRLQAMAWNQKNVPLFGGPLRQVSNLPASVPPIISLVANPRAQTWI